MFMEWLKKAPTSVIIAFIVVCGVGALAVLGGFVALEYAGRDTSEYSRFVNTFINAITLIVAGTGAVAGISAAKSASRAEDNTNGVLGQHKDTIAALNAENGALRERDAQTTQELRDRQAGR